MNFLIKRKKSKYRVNQLMVQIQELQDKVNSLNRSREFCDPETASSSGLSHVPSQPMSIQSPRGMIRRDSCLQPHTRKSPGTSGKVFGDRPAPSERPTAFYGNSISTAPAPCEPGSL